MTSKREWAMRFPCARLLRPNNPTHDSFYTYYFGRLRLLVGLLEEGFVTLCKCTHIYYKQDMKNAFAQGLSIIIHTWWHHRACGAWSSTLVVVAHWHWHNALALALALALASALVLVDVDTDATILMMLLMLPFLLLLLLMLHALHFCAST